MALSLSELFVLVGLPCFGDWISSEKGFINMRSRWRCCRNTSHTKFATNTHNWDCIMGPDNSIMSKNISSHVYGQFPKGRLIVTCSLLGLSFPERTLISNNADSSKERVCIAKFRFISLWSFFIREVGCIYRMCGCMSGYFRNNFRNKWSEIYHICSIMTNIVLTSGSVYLNRSAFQKFIHKNTMKFHTSMEIC